MRKPAGKDGKESRRKEEYVLCYCHWNFRTCKASIAFGNVENVGDLSKSYLSKLMGVKAILKWVYKVLE